MSNGYIQSLRGHTKVLEVDLEYAQELHDLHKDYPMAPEIMTISKDRPSNVQKDIHKILLQHGSKRQKNKEASLKCYGQEKVCVAHISLQFYLKHGLTNKKVHMAISFTQSGFSRPFIEFNVEKCKF